MYKIEYSKFYFKKISKVAHQKSDLSSLELSLKLLEIIETVIIQLNYNLENNSKKYY